MDKIGFIGAGNMGYPVLLGAKKAFGIENVVFTTKTAKRREEINKETGILFEMDNKTLLQECKYIVLAIKPQYFNDLYQELSGLITEEQVIISIAAGVTIAQMKEGLGANIRVVRSMPNTPAFVSEGMTCLSFSKDSYSEKEKSVITTLFSSIGAYQIIDEAMMNAAICANGSSPAYVYMFIEALADSVVKYGIPRNQAYTLVAQTVLGAAKMVLETGEHPGKLKDNVCSPGGTTIAAVAALEEYGFRNAIIKATDACYEKASAMQKK